MVFLLARLLSIHLVPPEAGLRRFVQGSVHPSTFASQFTQSEVKGRTCLLVHFEPKGNSKAPLQHGA